MALKKLEGWDNYFSPNSDMLAVDATVNSPFAWRAEYNCSFSGAITGTGNSLRFGSYGYIVGILSNGTTETLGGVRCLIPSLQNLAIGFFNSASQDPTTGVDVTYLLDALSGHVSVYRGGSFGPSGALGTLLGQSPVGNTFPVGSGFYLELDTVISSTAGGVYANINSVNAVQLTLQNTDPASAGVADGIVIGSYGGLKATGVLVDDFYLEDYVSGAGPLPFNNFLGPIECFTAFPNAAGAFTQWSPQPNTNANWQNVSETAMDSDATYNYTTSTGIEDLFPVTALPGGLFVYALATRIASRQALSGSHQLRGLLKSGTVIAVGASIAGQSTYAYQDDIYPFDPSNNGLWTPTSAGAIQVGYEPVS